MSAGIRFGVLTFVLLLSGALVYWTYVQYCDIANVTVLNDRVVAYAAISPVNQPALMGHRDVLLSGELRDRQALAAIQTDALWWLVGALAYGVAIACWWFFRVVWLPWLNRSARPSR